MDQRRQIKALEVSINLKLQKRIFTIHNYKSFFTKILIAVGIDILLLSILILWINATPDVSIIEVLILPMIFVINICLAVVSKFIVRKLYLTFLINSFLSLLIFHVLFNTWFTYYDHKNFETWHFSQNGKQYQLLLDHRDTSYSFSEIHIGSSDQFMKGRYELKKNVFYLIDPVNQMIVYQDSLQGFTKAKIALVKE